MCVHGFVYSKCNGCVVCVSLIGHAFFKLPRVIDSSDIKEFWSIGLFAFGVFPHSLCLFVVLDVGLLEYKQTLKSINKLSIFLFSLSLGNLCIYYYYHSF